MKIGVLFPQTEIGPGPAGVRDYARAVVDLGFTHLITYEHVLGAVSDRLPADYRPYGIEDPFHEVFTVFGFLAAVAPELELATGILVLPQRPTALVAKQAAEIDHLTAGKFRLGVGIGWNYAEFEGLGSAFADRARRMEEQIHLMRMLWTEDVVTFKGAYHTIEGCGIRPLPLQKPIPVWIGGAAEPALRRAATLGDGFFPQRPLEGGWQATLERMRGWREQAGLSWEGFGIEARVTIKDGWEAEVETWRSLGATHLSLSTMGLGLKGPAAHAGCLNAVRKRLSLLEH